jgi:hypothetical protein
VERNLDMEQDPHSRKDKVDATARDSSDEPKEGEAQVSRRRALLVGLAAVPVIMSTLRTSAWGVQPNCSIVASYVNGGYHFTSPQLPGHNVTIDRGDLQRCHL